MTQARSAIRGSVLAWTHRQCREVTAQIIKDLGSLGPLQGARILDLGCGSKPYQYLFATAAQYIGVDLPVQRSANKLRKSADLYADLAALPFENEWFDVVLSTQVLEHVPDPASVLAEARRVLRTGALVVLTVPFLAAEHEAPHDYLRFSSFGIIELLRRSGFEPVEVKKQYGFWAAIGEMIYWHYHRKVAGTRWEKYWFVLGTTLFLRWYHLLDRWDADDKLFLNLFATARKLPVELLANRTPVDPVGVRRLGADRK